MTELGPLVPADETLHHQITDTFATVSQRDRSWTEKVCAMAARQGRLDLSSASAWASTRTGACSTPTPAVSIGNEQWTVRASRRLGARRRTARGRADPLRGARAADVRALRARRRTTCCPISFEWTFTGVVPVARSSNPSTTAAATDCASTPTSSATTRSAPPPGGSRSTASASSSTTTTWVSTRDHSWGVRYMVGVPVDGRGARSASDAACRPRSSGHRS